jgi:alpha 1,2-mannosyltransferase
MPPASILESLFRRPQRLVVLLAGFLIFLTLATWVNLSPTTYDKVKTGWTNNMPAMKNPWATSTTSSGTAGSAAAAAAGYGAAKSASVAAQVEDMYTFDPANHVPTSPDDLLAWGHKGDDGNIYPPEFIPQQANKAPRAKAGFIVLVRNSELQALKESMRDVESKFNSKYGYPWIFLNNEPFSDAFKKGVRQMTRSEIRFGLVEQKHWGYPEWIDKDRAAKTRADMKAANIIYGDSESYRHMCRFQSGFFFHHPLTQDLDYYWRVEPGIKLYCDVDYDPFVFMQMNNKTYGFTMALHEYIATIPTLWETTHNFVKANPQYVAKDNGLHFMTDEPERGMDPGYNLCHFWSNFEIGDLRFWRGEAYTKYFDYLDKAGGFFYERWGDAPVHSIAAILFLDRSRLHHFDDIGYYHVPWDHCPSNKAKYHDTGRCNCDPAKSFDREGYSCLKEAWRTLKEGEPK